TKERSSQLGLALCSVTDPSQRLPKRTSPSPAAASAEATTAASMKRDGAGIYGGVFYAIRSAAPWQAIPVLIVPLVHGHADCRELTKPRKRQGFKALQP